jgi:hypothetical protein
VHGRGLCHVKGSGSCPAQHVGQGVGHVQVPGGALHHGRLQALGLGAPSEKPDPFTRGVRYGRDYLDVGDLSQPPAGDPEAPSQPTTLRRLRRTTGVSLSEMVSLSGPGFGVAGKS